MYTIYKYTNKENGKVYIGQTSRTLEERAQSNGHNYCECRKFYNAIKKYGWNSFEPTILETVETVEEANKREQFYINKYCSTNDKYGYNIALGGDNKIMSEESKKLISERAKDRYKDPTANPMYGKKHTDEAKKKQSECKKGKKNPMFGRKWTETQRLKCGTKGKKLNLSEEQREIQRERSRIIGLTTGLKKVLCVDDNIFFNSLTEAAKYYNVAVSTLSGALHGYQNTCAGKHFEFVIE